jgi:hypothetical protein
MDSDVSLRDVLEADLPIFFAYQLDSDAQAMATFISKDPANREAFLAHWQQILADPTTINRTIVVDVPFGRCMPRARWPARGRCGS